MAATNFWREIAKVSLVVLFKFTNFCLLQVRTFDNLESFKFTVFRRTCEWSFLIVWSSTCKLVFSFSCEWIEGDSIDIKQNRLRKVNMSWREGNNLVTKDWSQDLHGLIGLLERTMTVEAEDDNQKPWREALFEMLILICVDGRTIGYNNSAVCWRSRSNFIFKCFTNLPYIRTVFSLVQKQLRNVDSISRSPKSHVCFGIRCLDMLLTFNLGTSANKFNQIVSLSGALVRWF